MYSWEGVFSLFLERFWPNLEYLLSPTNQTAKPKDLKMQPRPQGAFPWLWRPAPKAREKRHGDEVAKNDNFCLVTTLRFSF